MFGVVLGDTAPADGELFPYMEATEKDKDAIRILSFNIRFGELGDVERKYRRDLVVQTIYDIEPDSFGVQEATPEWMHDLEKLLPQYGWVGLGRDGEHNGDHNAVFYKKDKYEVLESETFWLSETPEVVSKSWDASHTRICTWAMLRNKQTQKCYVHVNAHFDHRSTPAKRESAKLVCAMTERFTDLPVFFTADMNTDIRSQVYKTMTGSFHDSRTDAPITTDMVTYHNLFKDYTDIIDYVLYRGDVTPTVYRVVTKPVCGRYVSDHFPVYADFRLN